MNCEIEFKPITGLRLNRGSTRGGLDYDDNYRVNNDDVAGVLSAFLIKLLLLLIFLRWLLRLSSRAETKYRNLFFKQTIPNKIVLLLLLLNFISRPRRRRCMWVYP